MTDTTTRAKFVVCPDCLGEGTHGPGFVWTKDEIDEDREGFEETQRLLREGYFDVPCEFCKGKRVVEDLVEFDGVTTTAEERYRDECDYRAEVAAERRLGC